MLPWIKKLRRQSEKAPWPLELPLLHLSGQDVWRLADALTGLLILGATGSGKSSASGATFALAMLRAGFGMLILTVKNGERVFWERLCHITGRLQDLVVFSPSELLRFNVLEFERTRAGPGAGLTENIVNLFCKVIEAGGRNAGGGGGRDNELYWLLALKQLLRNAVDLLQLAHGIISSPELYRLIISAPTSTEQLRSEEWKQASFCMQGLRMADGRTKSRSQQQVFELIADYFLIEFPGLSDKTRSVIVSMFTSIVDVLNRGVLRDLFSADTNITPEVTGQGKILLIDMPALEFGVPGVFAQILWKHALQRWIERRVFSAITCPVALWCDEVQHYVTAEDQQFLTTSRAAGVATVMISQNVPNFYAALGNGDTGRATADSLFGNLCLKVFHANGDPVTNEWASSLIGRTKQLFVNGNSSRQGDWMSSAMGFEDPPNVSAGFSESYEYEVQPSAFTRLRTGGPANRYEADAIMVRSGQPFRETGRMWMPAVFKQT